MGVAIYEVPSGQVPFAQYKAIVVTRHGDKGDWFADDSRGMLELC